ncbi:MAG: ATP-binding protein [Streptosporangiaceae bacterium]
MIRFTKARLATGLLLLTVAALAAAAAFGVSAHDLADGFAFTPVLLAFAIVGAFVAARRPRNPIGWLFLAEGLSFAAGVATSAYAADATSLGVSPVADWAEWIGAIPGELGFLFALAILLFPDGALPSRRWRPLAWLLILAESLMLAAAVTSGAAMHAQGSRLPSPVTLIPESVAGPVLDKAQTAVIPLALAAAIGCVLRYRRTTADGRHQIKWFASAGAVTAIGMLALGLTTGDPLGAFLVLGPLLPVAAGIGIMKYRLYDIDVVINKALVYGALAVFITGVYVLVVVVIGSVGAGLATSGSRPGLALSILATAIVAVAFQPVRQRLQHLANRLVYGQRATPYEMLSAFSARMGEAYATEDLLPRLARMLAEGTAAARAHVWLLHEGELRAAASWPPDAAPPAPGEPESAGLGGRAVPAAEPASGGPAAAAGEQVALVRHQGELLGALSVVRRRNEPFTPAQDKLLGELAAQAGLVLRNVRLTAELVARLDELTASRQRIVTAQDQERLRIQRDIARGAQRQLAKLTASFRGAEATVGSDPQAQRTLMASLRSDVAAIVESLRELARGIYPPLLADQGLAAAVRAQAAKSGGPVVVSANGIGRYSKDIEAALYFCCLEALRNVGKYAAAACTRIELSGTDGAIGFQVSDDGPGFDMKLAGHGSGLQHMTDRLAALGGAIVIDSRPGAGTTVAGRIPLTASPAELPSANGSG